MQRKSRKDYKILGRQMTTLETQQSNNADVVGVVLVLMFTVLLSAFAVVSLLCSDTNDTPVQVEQTEKETVLIC